MATNQSLRAPLLCTSADPQLILDVHDPQSTALQYPDSQHSNPFAFLGSDNKFSVPETSTIDPFRNHTPRIEGFYEWLKIVICVPIAIVRLLLFGLCLLVGYVATVFALHGWRDRQNSMPEWRSRVLWIARICARVILFSFGYHWIKRRGKPAPREMAPIVVSNHVSYIEPIFFFYEFFPTIVASESHDSMPFVGTIIRAMQVIYVDRFSQSSRKNAVNEIKFPRVLLFPEGTTTNGRVLISFQLGAFIPGYPIQPVIVRYPHVHFDQSWGHIALVKLMFRMFTQLHNFMEVDYLPLVLPDEDQKENAVHFSQRTSRVIASSLNVVQTSHSYGDLMLLTKAAECKQEKPSGYMVEMAWVESSLHLRNTDAVHFLEVFLSMNPDPSGYVEFYDFLKILRLKPCGLAEKIFQFIDVPKIGKITFKQFLLGSAHVLKQPLFGNTCKRAFSELDREGKDYISKQELQDSITVAVPNMNDQEIHELFNLFDMDDDGRISRDDFFMFLRRNPLLIAVFSPQLLRQGLATAEDGFDWGRCLTIADGRTKAENRFIE